MIAAIQVMGSYKFYRLPIKTWAYRIDAGRENENGWRQIFSEHPEFFRLNTGDGGASLVWRRTQPKLYEVDAQRVLTQAEFRALSVDRVKRVSRKPLSPKDIQVLIDTAIRLHSRALAAQMDRRWWIPVLASFAGAGLGSLITLIHR